MRSEVVHCINVGNLERFPSEMACGLPVVDKVKLKLYCKCKIPVRKGQENVAYCSKCHEWYHKSCADIPDVIFTDSRKTFTCSE